MSGIKRKYLIFEKASAYSRVLDNRGHKKMSKDKEKQQYLYTNLKKRD